MPPSLQTIKRDGTTFVDTQTMTDCEIGSGSMLLVTFDEEDVEINVRAVDGEITTVIGKLSDMVKDVKFKVRAKNGKKLLLKTLTWTAV